MVSAKNLLLGAQKSVIDLRKAIFYRRQFKHYLKINHFPNSWQSGEDEYIAKWNVFGHKVEPYSYRLFSHYMEPCPEIVPENIGRSYIEPVLNPVQMRPYYSDKNMFPTICGQGNVPKTLICRINGGPLLNDNFHPISSPIDEVLKDETRIILKPSVDSCSGLGIELWRKENGKWISASNGQILTEGYLLNYGKNFVLQHAINQHKDMAVFNKSSVNTLRLAIYRSVKDDEPHVCAAIMRVGRSGEYVDNAHRGGVFVGVNINTGQVGNKCYDQYGRSQMSWNGVDYSKQMSVPKWEEVKRFACEVARKLYHHRLIAMDIAVTEDGRPQLIEYNLEGFSYWLFMFTEQKPLGDFTDEIIEFCAKYKY